MEEFIVYLDIPPIPEHLLESPLEIINKPPIDGSSVLPAYSYFQTRHVGEKLKDWIQKTFNTDCYVQYQIVLDGLHIHKDKGRNVAFNYIIEAGGDKVETLFFNESKELVKSYGIKTKSWHRIKTDVYHTVKACYTPRVAVSVHIYGYTWGDTI